ncbi:hypothetical protein DUNSADRAFT_16124 [Dunaliella salina]|uniref:Encoded protein n=1 Tax=Dunaliella salina TaxID=3046 RepID=A0ABQ7H182_DUNSA|nr:hypothetical protein DUNSADRAFT_16124 [Dunaliella salina]|eukprot:KAF5840609.1 hypothetical protein DUNSADRAFT_16124 [Dunaliella salina]
MSTQSAKIKPHMYDKQGSWSSPCMPLQCDLKNIKHSFNPFRRHENRGFERKHTNTNNRCIRNPHDTILGATGSCRLTHKASSNEGLFLFQQHSLYLQAYANFTAREGITHHVARLSFLQAFPRNVQVNYNGNKALSCSVVLGGGVQRGPKHESLTAAGHWVSMPRGVIPSASNSCNICTMLAHDS